MGFGTQDVRVVDRRRHAIHRWLQAGHARYQYQLGATGGVRPYKAVGCLECRNTGFMGRTGVYEMLELSPRLRGLVSAQLDLARLGEAALAEGMQPLRISAAAQVAKGLTTVPEVLTVLPPIEHASQT